MPKSRPPFAPEFRRQMVELVRSGRTPAELAREFEVSANSIRIWVRQDALDEGRLILGVDQGTKLFFESEALSEVGLLHERCNRVEWREEHEAPWRGRYTDPRTVVPESMKAPTG